MLNSPLLQLDLPGVKKVKSGKVREIFDLGDRLLFVATDRISAFDCVMPNGIPRKGEVLTQLSYFWFDLLAPLVTPTTSPPAPATRCRRNCANTAAELAGRSMVVKKAQPAGHRVRRARLPHRLGLEGLPENRVRLRHQTADRPAKFLPACPPRFSLPRPRPKPAMTKTFPSRKPAALSGRTWRKKPAI
jgi:hypothetical protein